LETLIKLFNLSGGNARGLQMTQTQHTATTPRPWTFSHQDPWAAKAIILDANPMPDGKKARLIKHIATVEIENRSIKSEKGLANAEFIVQACNSYDEMLAFIEKVAAGEFTWHAEAQAEAFELIKKVRG